MRAAAASTPCRVGRPIVISLDSLRRARATALHGNRNDSLSLAIIQGMENRQVFTAECHEPISRLRSPMGTSKPQRSEEHTSELQSLMRISYAVFCLKKKKQ